MPSGPSLLGIGSGGGKRFFRGTDHPKQTILTHVFEQKTQTSLALPWLETWSAGKERACLVLLSLSSPN